MLGTVAPGKQCVPVLKKQIYLNVESLTINVVGRNKGRGEV